MQRALRHFVRTGQLVQVIYIDRRGNISQRTLRLYAVEGERVKAYCLTRRAYRVFAASNILAVMPAGARTGTDGR